MRLMSKSKSVITSSDTLFSTFIQKTVSYLDYYKPILCNEFAKLARILATRFGDDIRSDSFALRRNVSITFAKYQESTDQMNFLSLNEVIFPKKLTNQVHQKVAFDEMIVFFLRTTEIGDKRGA